MVISVALINNNSPLPQLFFKKSLISSEAAKLPSLPYLYSLHFQQHKINDILDDFSKK
jgi:hypothetical protein